MADSYQVDPTALNETAKGIGDAIGELKKLGIAEGAEVGRGFSNIALTGMQVGNGDLQGALQNFCDRWSWQVRRLVHDGNDIAQKLHLSAGRYYDQEQYTSGALKDLANAAIGNPDLTDKQVEGESWDTVLGNNPYTQIRGADYSQQSLNQAMLDSKAAWESTGADMLNSNPELKALNELPGNGAAVTGDEAKRLEAEAEKNRALAQQMGDHR
ncbi:hypothetical protein P3T35_007478 [Kitasatospora sp. GP30]|uniref:hypothetical protein n=1 Tax=Kitasatospora sp. GP30 TaxID=3035084 RepID=UPI000C704253|nr:hypothetical protein [Kitasatospora sp. GP30]MDH6145423.1 hypothetical protein [Kitasatospora sp. GP30]